MSDALTPFQQEAQRVGGLNPLDLEAEKKRVRSLLKTAEGREALRRELGYNFLFRDEALADGRPLVSLLVPSRENPRPETTAAVEKMIIASRQHCILTPDPGISSSVIHWSRNGLFINLRKRGQPADYVLLMDDDMTPPPDTLVKLLSHDKDIVAAACTVRKDPPLPNFREWVPEIFNFKTIFDWPTDELIEVAGVGTACILIRTTVLDAVGEYYLSCAYEKKYFGMSDEVAEKLSAGRRKNAEKSGNEWWFQFLPHPWGDGEFGEDLSFCFKAHECGYKIWVDTSITPGHVGSYEYGIKDFLSYQAEVIANEQVTTKEES